MDRNKQFESNVANKKIIPLLENRDFFEQKLQDLRESINGNEDVKMEDADTKTIEGRDINVCVRARPLLDFELQQGYYDITHAHQSKFHFFEPKLNVKQDPIIDK